MWAESQRDSYRLHQDVVLAVQQVSPGVLVQRLHVLPRRRSKPVLRHAATGLPLADLGKILSHSKTSQKNKNGHTSSETHPTYHREEKVVGKPLK